MSHVEQNTQGIDVVGDVVEDVATEKREAVVEKVKTAEVVDKNSVEVAEDKPVEVTQKLEKVDEESAEEIEKVQVEDKAEQTKDADEELSSQHLSQTPVAVVPPTKRVLEEVEEEETCLKKVKVVGGGDAPKVTDPLTIIV